MKSVNQIVKEQKKYNEETEFYPTSERIVGKIAAYISEKSHEEIYSILDIGCGNGGFFEKLDRTAVFHDYNAPYGSKERKSKLVKTYKKYGIEKSLILRENCNDDVIIIGTDFMENQLIDKKTDLVFCNPPYSQFKEWTRKIISEANAPNIVLVIPSRWSDDEEIKDLIEKRRYTYEIIDTDNFLDAERKARCSVDIVYINSEYTPKDAFDFWFENTFKINAEKKQSYSYESDEKKAKEEKVKSELVEGTNAAEVLVRLYNNDMEKLYKNYRALEEIDASLFSELKINIDDLKEGLKTKISGLKNFYWKELFSCYNRITKRITSKKRDEILSQLNDSVNIDFTENNIYMLTMWIINNSNKIFDEQLKDYFFSLCNEKNIHRYKSNKRWNDEEWKYIKDCCSKRDKEDCLKFIQLDYRIIVNGFSNFEYDWWDKCCKGNFTKDGCDFVNDTLIIARNLGFNVSETYEAKMYDRSAYESYRNIDIYTTDGEVLCNLKMYQNGNRHVKFNPKFMKKLNIEMARINGWVKNKREASCEFNTTETEISRCWNTNMHFNLNDGLKLIGMAS